MKFPHKWQLQQSVINHSSDIELRDFVDVYKKSNAKPYSFSVTDNILASVNLLCFRKNLYEKIEN